MQVYAWMEFPRLIFGSLFIEVCHSSPNQRNNTKDQEQGNLSRDSTSNKHTQSKTKVPTQHDNFDQSDVDYVPSNAKFPRFGATLHISEDHEAAVKMIIKGRSPTTRHVPRTHRAAPDRPPRQNQPGSQDSKQECRHQTPTRRHVHKREFHTRWVEQSSSFVQLQPFQPSLLRSEFQLSKLSHEGEKDARTERRQQDRGKVKADDDEPDFNCLDKFLNCEQSDCVEKPGCIQSSILSNRLVKFRETWRKKFQSWRSVEFWRMAKRCISGCRYEETRRDRRRPGTPEISWRFGKNEETRPFRKLRNRRQWQNLATTISICQQIMWCTWKRFSRSWD